MLNHGATSFSFQMSATTCDVLSSPSCPPTVRTAYLGRRFNGAIAALGDGSWPRVFTSNADAKSAAARARNCTTEHSIELRELRCSSASKAHSIPLLAKLTSVLPARTCIDMLNFRGNGPEDARVLPLPFYYSSTKATQQQTQRVMLLYVDYAVAPPSLAPSPPHHRRMHLAVLTIHHQPPPSTTSSLFGRGMPSLESLAGGGKGGSSLRVDVGPIKRIEPSSSGIANLSAIEKNWVPFVCDDTPGNGGGGNGGAATSSVCLQQWLDDGHGTSVAYKLDLTTGILLERYESRLPTSLPSDRRSNGAGGLHARSSGGVLQRAMGAAAHATVSGGTPALRLNRTHYLAVGHTMTWACNLPEVRESKAKRQMKPLL